MLDHAENELWKQPPDPVLEAVAKIVSDDNREWEGSPTELPIKLLQEIFCSSCALLFYILEYIFEYLIDVYKRQEICCLRS